MLDPNKKVEYIVWSFFFGVMIFGLLAYIFTLGVEVGQKSRALENSQIEETYNEEMDV